LPRAVVLLASLLLLGIAGSIVVIGLLAPAERKPPLQLAVAGGDPERGRWIIRGGSCPACHVIPGIAGAEGLVGPPLDRFARRAYVGGVVPNRPQNLVAWILDPPAIDPLTAMPATGVSEPEARDIAAYLYTLR
jgi:cytochrome c